MKDFNKYECKPLVLFSLLHQYRFHQYWCLLATMIIVHIKGLYVLYFSCKNRIEI